MKRVAILISGGGSNMEVLVRAMTGDFPARPVVVLSNNPDVGGLAKAQTLGVPTEVLDHRLFKGDRESYDHALTESLSTYEPDVICLAGFMRILTPAAITPFAGRMLNIHPSLLPKYPGLHTHERALEAGDREAGCSVHLVTPDLDAGPVLGRAIVTIDPADTPETLAARVLVQEHKLYPLVLQRFCHGQSDVVTLT